MKILCTGDIHIGRGPSRLPSSADPRPLSCGACWGAIVERAIEEEVDLVAISGDVVDRANRFFEAYGPLERGFRQLADAGIRSVAVAGNHDFDVLPRLAQSLGDEWFRLLGHGGRWERHSVELGGERLHVDGWSFPRDRFASSPLDSYDLDPAGDGFLLGLLHCDLDARESGYAPVPLAALRGRPHAFWLLGHTHSPALRDDGAGAPVLYPGSPQAMDPGETGAHGVWLLEVEPGRAPSARLLPLSRVRYDALEVDVSDVDDAADLPRAVAEAAKAALHDVARDCGPLRHLLLRVRLVGRTPLHRELHRSAAEHADLELTVDEVTARVERVELATRPAVDLLALSKAGDPPGTLARMLLALAGDASDGERAELMRRAGRAVHAVAGAGAYLGLEDSPGDEDTARLLERQGWLLLDELLAQKEAGS